MKNTTCYFSALLVFSLYTGTFEKACAQTYIHVIEGATGTDFIQQSIIDIGNNQQFVVVGTVSGNSDIFGHYRWIDR